MNTLTRSLLIFVEVSILHHQIAGDDRQRKINAHFRLACLQLHALGFVPHA